jgi:hypothetical protein
MFPGLLLLMPLSGRLPLLRMKLMLLLLLLLKLPLFVNSKCCKAHCCSW